MDRGVLQGIFERADTRRQRVVRRGELIAVLAEDESLSRLLDLPPEKVGPEVRAAFREAFANGDDREDPFVTFEEFAAYLELSFKIAAHTHGDTQPPPADQPPGPPPLAQPVPEPQPEPEPQMMPRGFSMVGGELAPAPQPTGFDEFRGGDRGSYVDYSYSPASQSPDRSVEGLAQHLAALEARAAAEELIQREAGSPGSNDLSREELELQQQIRAVEHDHLGLGARPNSSVVQLAAVADMVEPTSRSADAPSYGASMSTLHMDPSAGRKESLRQLASYDGGHAAIRVAEDPGGPRGLGPRGLVAEVYGPSNPHGRSVWRHTPYGQDPDLNGTVPRLGAIGHRSVSDEEGSPSPPVRNGIADRSRAMLLERTGSHIPSPRAMLSPARVSRTWSPVRTSAGADVTSNGSISQRSRALAAERRSPPRNRSGVEGAYVGARQRLATSGRLASHRDASPGRSLPAAVPALPSRSLSPGRTATRDAAGAHAGMQAVARVENVSSRGRALSPGRTDIRDARGADAEVHGAAQTQRRNAQRGSSAENTSSPAVGMNDLEQMQARRKNRARGVVESFNAESSGGTDSGHVHDTAAMGTVVRDRVGLARPEAEEDLAHGTAVHAPVVDGFDAFGVKTTSRSVTTAATAAARALGSNSADQSHTETTQDSSRTTSPSRQSDVRVRSPRRETRRTGDARSRQPAEAPRQKSSYSPARRRDRSSPSRSASRASTTEFLDKLKSISASGRPESDRTTSRQRNRGFSDRASAPQRALTLAPELPARNYQRQTAASRRPAYDRDGSHKNEYRSASVGRAGRSPVERPGSRGRGAAPSTQAHAAAAHGAAPSRDRLSASTSSHNDRRLHQVTTSSTRAGRASLSAMHTSAPAGDLRAQRVSLLQAARGAARQ